MRKHTAHLLNAWLLGVILVPSSLAFRPPTNWFVLTLGVILITGAVGGLIAVSMENWRKGPRSEDQTKV